MSLLPIKYSDIPGRSPSLLLIGELAVNIADGNLYYGSKNGVRLFSFSGSSSTNTGSLLLTASVNLNTITFTKGNGSTFAITVDTGSGSPGSGTVTSIATAGLISGGTITTTGTISTSMNTNRLVGRSTAGVGIMEEITIGSGLSLSGGTLSATGGGGTFPFDGSAVITGSLLVSGSGITITGSLNISGSLNATSSWAINALTSSNIQGGAANYIPLWKTDTSLTSSFLYQNNNVLTARSNSIDNGLMIDFGSNQYRIGGFGASPFNYIGIDPNFTQLFGSNVILDASSATLEISSGLIKTTSGASNIKGLKLDFNNNVYSLGDTDDLNTLTKIKVDESSQSVIITGSLTTTGSVFFPFLIEQSQNNVVLIDTSTGQLYYTASSAIGGGGSGTPGGTDQTIQFNSASVFSGSAKLKYDYTNSNIILTGSLLVTQSYISKVDYVEFTSASDQLTAVGRLGWNNSDGTLSLGLKGGNVDLLVGETEVAYVYNAEATTLTKGEVVFITGSQGNRVSVKRAAASSDPVSAGTLGFVAEPIISGQTGFVITSGVINKLDTSAYTEGALVYLSSSAGQYTTVKPVSPIHEVRLGYIQRSHPTVGSIYVKVDNGYEIGELHDVLDNTTSSSYGDLLVKSGSLWINSKQLTGSYGLTGSLTVTQNISASSFTGSLFGTASWAHSASNAINAQTASYVTSSNVFGPYGSNSILSASFALTASIATTAITSSYPISVTGSGTTLYSVSPLANPNFGEGATHSIFFGQEAGYLVSDAYYANFIGRQAGYTASYAEDSNFLGYRAGFNATYANRSNFLGSSVGSNATYASQSNFFGHQAGFEAYTASNSNFLGYQAGFQAYLSNDSTFMGYRAGYLATTASDSVFIGYETGRQASRANNSIFIGSGSGNGATNSNNSVFLGSTAGKNASSAHSIFIGTNAGSSTSGGNSIIIGRDAGSTISSTSNSILIGYQAGKRITGTGIGNNNIIIGTNITLPNGTSNAVNIGGALYITGIYGNTTGDPLTGSYIDVLTQPKVGIGTFSPSALLHINQIERGNPQFIVSNRESGSVFRVDENSIFAPQLRSLPVGSYEIVVRDTATGQLYVVSSSNFITGSGSGTTPPGGADTQIQYNNGGAFGGSSYFIYNYVNNSLKQGNTITARGAYSHGEGCNTFVGQFGYHASDVTSGVITLDVAYGDVKNTGVAEADGFIILDDTAYSNTYGVRAFTIASVAGGPPTTITLNNAGITTSEAIIYIPGRAEPLRADILLPGDCAHSEGSSSIASGNASHAAGIETNAFGNYSYAGGQGTVATSVGQTVVGKYNLPNSAIAGYDNSFIIGKGTSTSVRTNMFEAVPSADTLTISASYVAIKGIPRFDAQPFLLAYETSSGQIYFSTASLVGGGSTTTTLSRITTGSVTASTNVGTGNVFTVTSASIAEFAVAGTGVTIGNVITDQHTVTGSLSISGSTTITGSLRVRDGITGSLFGTASWATNALTASYVLASNIAGDISRIAIGSVTASVGNSSGNIFNIISGSSTFVNITNNGDVGIGAPATSTTKLQISSSTNLSLGIVRSTTNAGYLSLDNATFAIAVNRNPVGSFIDTSKASSQINLFTGVSDSNIKFYTTTANNTLPSERMIITKDGNVGINRTAPIYTLDVSGSINFIGDTIVTGSFTVITGSSVEFQVINTGVRIGNIITDTHTVTGSFNISGSTTIRGNTRISGSVFISGSLIPNVNGTQTSSFNLGSPTAAWKALYVATRSIHFVDVDGIEVANISVEPNGGGGSFINIGDIRTYDENELAFRGIEVDRQQGFVFLGDYNKTLPFPISLNLIPDANQKIYTEGSSSGESGFKVDFVNDPFPRVWLGDFNGTGKSTSLIINDFFQTITTSGSFIMSGSLNVTQGITGSLQGTSSFALTASHVLNGGTSTIPTQIVTGSVTASVTLTQFSVTSGSITEFSVAGTGVTIGNTASDIHKVTGSFNISGSTTVNGQLFLSRYTSATAFTSSTTTASLAVDTDGNVVTSPFYDSGEKTYTGTVTWTGTTAPSGATTHSYHWSRVGNLVTVRLNLAYAVAGNSLTLASATLPTDCPIPISPSGVTAASEAISYGTGILVTVKTVPAFTTVGAGMSALRRNSGNNGYDIAIIRASANYQYGYATIQYYA